VKQWKIFFMNQTIAGQTARGMNLELFERKESVRARGGYRLGIADGRCWVSGLVEVGGALEGVGNA
jgi:hypothetical protein